MFGISLARREFPDVLLPGFADRISRRREDADEEVHFLDHQRPRVLPVWFDGQLQMMSWGRWCPMEEVSQWQGEEAWIPATFICDQGVWTPVACGMRGIIKARTIHPLSQPATHYYNVMTRSQRMPAFMGETI